VNLAAVSLAELRGVTLARRRPRDPVSVVLGRYPQVLAAAGELDGDIALSYVLWPSDGMLEAVALAEDVAA
jgi:hypothetical protein